MRKEIKKKIHKMIMKICDFILPDFRNVYTIDGLWAEALDKQIKKLKQLKIK